MKCTYTIVIDKCVVARKIKLTRRFSLFCLLNKKINKRMKYLAGGRWVSIRDELLLWSGQTVLSGDTFRRPAIQLACDQLMCSWFQTPAPENATSGKNMIGWKIDFFFITENFLGILDRLCAEPMCRSYDFLSLTLTVVGSTSGSCYFLLQCRCLWVCVLCVLVGVWRIKWMNQKRFDVFYYNKAPPDLVLIIMYIWGNLCMKDLLHDKVFETCRNLSPC